MNPATLHLAIPMRVRFLVTIAIGTMFTFLPCMLWAQETGQSESSLEAPVELIEPAPAPSDEQSADGLPELAGRIVTDMRAAESRLADGRLDEATGELQDRIQADIARLLATLEQQASQPAPVPGDDSQQQTTGTDSSSSGGTGDPGGPSGSQGESSEGDRPGEITEAELERRRNLATSVWGHLPEKERDEMLGTFSERFLPAYDDLVRQYYEALFRRKAQER